MKNKYAEESFETNTISVEKRGGEGKEGGECILKRGRLKLRPLLIQGKEEIGNNEKMEHQEWKKIFYRGAMVKIRMNQIRM